MKFAAEEEQGPARRHGAPRGAGATRAKNIMLATTADAEQQREEVEALDAEDVGQEAGGDQLEAGGNGPTDWPASSQSVSPLKTSMPARVTMKAGIFQ